MRVLVVGFFSGALAAFCMAPVFAAPPFELKGLSLGMKADKFKEKYFFARCVELSKEDRRLGDRACMLVADRPLMNIPLELLTLAGADVSSYTFYFFGDTVEVIEVMLPASTTPDLVAGLTARFGKPVASAKGVHVWKRRRRAP